MKLDNSYHVTSTGKVFQLLDLNNNPIEYSQGKEVFNKLHLANLEVDQIVRSKSAGMMLKRIK